MEILDQNLEEFFYLNPFLAEIYTTSATSSDGGAAAVDQLQMSSTSLTNSWNGQEIISGAAAVEAPQLISFENNERLSSSFSPSYEDQNTDCNVTPKIISFSSSSSAEDDSGKRERVLTATRTPSQAQDHLMSERKRRENLRQLFIDLSKIVPGLRKLDKATLLEDAINHLKALEERVIALEKRETTMDSASASKQDNATLLPSSNACELGSAEISVRTTDLHVLIKICCKKQMGLMARIPSELEKINLNVIDIRIMPFGQEALDVTILAEMKSDFVGTVNDIINHLQSVLGTASQI